MPPVEPASCQMSGLRQHARVQFIPRSNNSRRGHATAPQCGIGPAQPMFGPAAEALPSELPELDGDHHQRPGVSAAKGLPRSPPIAISQPGPCGIPHISNGTGPVRTTPLPMTCQPPSCNPREQHQYLKSREIAQAESDRNKNKITTNGDKKMTSFVLRQKVRPFVSLF